MIAEFKTGDGRTAKLDNDGKWSASSSSMMIVLDAVFSPLKQGETRRSRAMPNWGLDEARRAAEFYGAELSLPAVGKIPAETVF